MSHLKELIYLGFRVRIFSSDSEDYTFEAQVVAPKEDENKVLTTTYANNARTAFNKAMIKMDRMNRARKVAEFTALEDKSIEVAPVLNDLFEIRLVGSDQEVYHRIRDVSPVCLNGALRRLENIFDCGSGMVYAGGAK